MQYTASVILGNFPESLTDRAAGNHFFEARQVKIVELVLNVSDTRASWEQEAILCCSCRRGPQLVREESSKTTDRA